MSEKIQLFLTLDHRTQLYMDIDIPFLYEDAYIEPGTYPIDIVIEGYVHIQEQGLLKLTPEVHITCPQCTQDDHGYCHWHSECTSNLCFESCVLRTASKIVPMRFVP